MCGAVEGDNTWHPLRFDLVLEIQLVDFRQDTSSMFALKKSRINECVEELGKGQDQRYISNTLQTLNNKSGRANIYLIAVSWFEISLLIVVVDLH